MVAKRFPPRGLLAELALLRERREPYSGLLAQIVAGIFAQFPPPDDKPIIEIGAGTGQFREWIPAPVRGRLVHTDPSAPALRELRDRAPDAKTRVAAADHLPFEDGVAGAIVGLCVFDALSDQPAAVAEMGRVLAPGGRFIHIMDMATLLEAPFEKLAAAALVPIPNVFGDPGDYEWPLDIVLVKRSWLDGLLGFANRVGHSLATEFGAYFRALGADPFDAMAATNAFKAVASSGDRRRALRALLESASQLAFSEGYPPIEPLPFHSGRYLQSVLEATFRESDRFRIEVDQIVARAGRRVRAPGADIRYQSLCVGHQRILDRIPGRLLTEFGADLSLSQLDARREVLIEVGAFVFVATRTA